MKHKMQLNRENFNVVLAYLQLNLKMLFKDKLSFVWSITLPTFFVIYNSNQIHSVNEVGGYQIYIIFTAYIYGIVLHSINIKETGCLKVFFSIKQTKFEFFFANLLTQVIFSEICLLVLDFVSSIILKFSFIKLLLNSILLIVMRIPIPFLFFSITLISKLKYQIANTLFTILITICLLTIGEDTIFNYINPLYLYIKVLYIHTITDMIIYIVFAMVSFGVGYLSIKKYSVLSSEVR